MKLPRALSPNTNPALYTAAASLAFTVWQAVQVQAAHGPLTWAQVGRVAVPIVVAALAGYWQRAKTTPVADPKDGNGAPLVSGNVKTPLVLTADEAASIKKMLASVKVMPYGASGAVLQPEPVVQPPATGTGPAQ